MRFHRLLAISVSAVLLAACGGGGGDQAARVDEAPQQDARQDAQQATLPARLCDLLPRADAEKIMGKALVEQRNDDAGCHYRDAKDTAGTGVSLDVNILKVSDQCRLVPGSEPVSGVGSEASEKATAVARVVLSKLGA